MTSSTSSTNVYEKYLASPPEVYEQHFVPAIGSPSAALVVEAARLRAGERVLDVACGTGVATRLAAEQVGPTGSVTGVDIHPGMLQVAREAVPATTVEWQEAPADQLPLSDDSFDAVLCSISLQFFPDKEAALSEAHRVLVPGGRIAVGTPGPTPPLMAELRDALAERVGPEVAGFVEAIFALHEPADVEALMGAAGFTDVEVATSPLPLRLPPPADFLWQFLQGTPLALATTQMDHDHRLALERDVVERWQPFTDGDGALTMAPGLTVARGHRKDS